MYRSSIIQGNYPGCLPRSRMPARLSEINAGANSPIIQPHAQGEAFQLPSHLASFGSSPGRSLPDSVKERMETFFRTDFSDVRVHVGPQASSIGALAFTHGSNLYFAPGQYNPETPQGLQLIGHELTHVVQQRAGRVRNPFGSGVAVVQDTLMEAEADRMGQLAALQPKMQPTRTIQAPTIQRYRTTAPVQIGASSYKIVANSDAGSVGSVLVHDRSQTAVEVTDLGVEQVHRKNGVGGILMASAARTGLQLGKTHINLASQDNGSGRLTHWYQGMGFTRVGMNQYGYAELQAPISRVLSSAPRAGG